MVPECPSSWRADGPVPSFRVAKHRPDEFDESSHDSEKNASQVKPCGMQPSVEPSTGQPSHHERRGQDERELAVARELQPEILLLFGILIVG